MPRRPGPGDRAAAVTVAVTVALTAGPVTTGAAVAAPGAAGAVPAAEVPASQVPANQVPASQVPAAGVQTDGPGVRSPLSARPQAMWQTDGTVLALVVARGVLFVGGDFSRVRPPGTAPGAPGELAQASLAAFRVSDGALVASWRPRVSGAVRALEVSPDGARLFVGGDFTAVDGSPRPRLAAFDISRVTAPVLLPRTRFAAAVSAPVTALAATRDRLYVGGAFTRAGGAARTRVAAFAAGSGALLPWQVDLQGAEPGAAPSVTALVAARGRIYVGGTFSRVDGVDQHALAVLDPVTGARDRGFAVPPVLHGSTLTALLVDGTSLYVAGRSDSTDLRRLEGVMAVDADSGAVRWGADRQRCLGDSFALAQVAGSVWVGTHAHDCSAVGGHPEESFPGRPNPRFYASTLAHDPQTGVLRHFFPDTAGSSAVPGSRNNVRALATDGSRLFVGGGWLEVNGVPQQNLTSFSPRARTTSAAPLPAPLRAQVEAGGDVRLSWTSTSDRDDRALTYEVYRDREAAPFARTAADSVFWSRRQMGVVDPAPPRGRRVTYRLVVTDGETRVASRPVAVAPPA